MRRVILFFLLLPFTSGTAFSASPKSETDTGEAMLKAMTQCRAEPSSLVRLDCYDRLFTPAYPDFSGALVKAQVQGEAWQRAFGQESQRDDHSTHFLITQTEGEHPSVVITTPALGSLPPRPVLMFSCIDNITRMQIALPKPLSSEPDLAITTEKSHTNAHWFLRENDSLLDSSHGLPGIDEIKQLFGAKMLTIALSFPAQATSAYKNTSSQPLTFDINDLEKTLAPLRVACHWANE
ncbi:MULTISPECIES: type VI secretion system-associated protein VasI [Rahnella]|uniref:Type VI secretion system-associated protein TagO n=2 Tax=Yersiniaceae TaxID=1903411 RepID=A0ABS0E979_9GAMM|nr:MULTISPECIES: type VI secretion system-associated protein VasI [Rahnella]MBF7981643.1 type VI secretion system-associated protein TagO [Rahnella laticis]MBF8001746.1 type VI secretion system-associated protein TagO [Rahnella sp. LAC-M12]